MPIYVYKCVNCEHSFEIEHGMDERLYDCDKCKVHGVLNKIPSLTSIKINNEANKLSGKVSNKIEDLREDLKQTKEELKKREWKP